MYLQALPKHCHFSSPIQKYFGVKNIFLKASPIKHVGYEEKGW